MTWYSLMYWYTHHERNWDISTFFYLKIGVSMEYYNTSIYFISKERTEVKTILSASISKQNNIHLCTYSTSIVGLNLLTACKTILGFTPNMSEIDRILFHLEEITNVCFENTFCCLCFVHTFNIKIFSCVTDLFIIHFLPITASLNLIHYKAAIVV